MNHTADIEALIHALDAAAPLNPNALRAAQGASLVHLAGGAIGVFDSGLGGLSVWRHLHALMPHENFIYLADNANVPYGDKSEAWIRERMECVTAWFLAQGCKAIVWACNTATAAGATCLRERHPEVFFVGLEPAVKPAVGLSKNGKISMLATHRTVDSAKYRALIARTLPADGRAELQSIACIGWAEAIDSGKTDGTHQAQWLALLARYLQPVQEFGADVVVLGCTHYPFIADDISAYLGDDVILLDSGAPVARYTYSVLAKRQGLNPSQNLGQTRHYATHVDEAVVARWRAFSGVAQTQVHPLDLSF